MQPPGPGDEKTTRNRLQTLLQIHGKHMEHSFDGRPIGPVDVENKSQSHSVRVKGFDRSQLVQKFAASGEF